MGTLYPKLEKKSSFIPGLNLIIVVVLWLLLLLILLLFYANKGDWLTILYIYKHNLLLIINSIHVYLYSAFQNTYFKAALQKSIMIFIKINISVVLI